MNIKDNGYVVFPGLVPADLCERVAGDILKHTCEPDGHLACGNLGMVELYHTQAMWDVRQHPAVYDAFRSVLGRDDLWVSIDRCNLKKSTVNDDGTDDGLPEGFIHWDMNINQKPRPFEVQGLVALRDTTEEMGGFQCVPALYRGLDEWLRSLPTRKAIYPSLTVQGGKAWDYLPKGWADDRMPRSWPVEKVPLKQGDLLVWDSALSHGNGPNRGDRPRLAMYVSMRPPGDLRERMERQECWLMNAPPSGWAFLGDPRGLEWKRPVADLTHLGMRLLTGPYPRV